MSDFEEYRAGRSVGATIRAIADEACQGGGTVLTLPYCEAFHAAADRIAALEEALRQVLQGLPYLGLSSQENWECDHGFPLDECPNDDCGEAIAQRAIASARELLNTPDTASERRNVKENET